MNDFILNTKLEDELSWLNGRYLFCSISGGKDSVAMALWLKSQGVLFNPLFIDTGWEHSATYEYINNILSPLFGAFTIIKNTKYQNEDQRKDGWNFGFEQMILKKKMFPSGAVKFCTHELKLNPLRNFYDEIRPKLKAKPINAVGLRRQESFKRSLLDDIQEQDEATTWRPILNLNENDVIDLHHKYNVPPNPLYLKGYTRVGCYPCIYSRKDEIKLLSIDDPQRIKQIQHLEERVSKLRDQKKRATFFKSRRKDKEPQSIVDVVEWSKGKDRDLAHSQQKLEEDGCMRWGLCEPVGMQLELFKA